MRSNPYAGAKLVLKSGAPIEEFRNPGSNLRALSSATGEFNANDKGEIINTLRSLTQAFNRGEIVDPRMSALASSEAAQRFRQDQRELVANALADTTGAQWNALGADVAMKITEQVARDGLMRRVALGNTLKQGEAAMVNMTRWDVAAIIATSASDVGYQIVRVKRYQNAEFEIIANVRVEQLELDQVSGDLLDDAYQQGLDAIMVQEDRLWKRAADMAVGLDNPISYIGSQLTPQILASLRNQISGWGLPVTNAIMANDLWNDVISNNDFVSFLDPVTKYDLALHGRIGTLVGMEFITDAFRPANQRVLADGEIYAVSSPEFHAVYTDRGGVRATPTSGANQGNTTRGWLLSEPLSFALPNTRSIAKAMRL